MKLLNKLWASLNYRFCRSQEYLALNRHDILEAVDWARRANKWQAACADREPCFLSQLWRNR